MAQNPHAFDPQNPQDVSRMTIEEIFELRDAIMERARKEIDPRGVGFDPLMMGTDDMSFFSTDDMIYPDWRDWVTQLTHVVRDGFTRVGTGLIAGGGAIAASNMYASGADSRFAGATLAGAALFAGWFVVGSVMSGAKR